MHKDMEVTESLGSVAALTGTRYKIRLIEGNKLGSKAYYPAEVLLRDGPKVFKRGTPMFVDHQTAEEKANKPFGSVSNYVGELAENAYYENDGLYAEVEVFEDAAPLIKSRKDKIGISVRANIVAETGTINGKQVPIAKSFTEARSVDFVMRPGAGGKIVSILESATEENTAEESGETMDEKVLEAIAGLKDAFEGRFTAIEEQLTKAPAAEVVESSVEEAADEVNAKALEIAEAFINSTLDAEGRSRVLELHKATGKAVVELVEAEEAYVGARRSEAHAEGIEETAVEESAKETKQVTMTLPSVWKKDK